MSPFEIGIIVYIGTFMSLAFWGLAITKRRAGGLMPQFLQRREEIGKLLKQGAVSTWDPFHPQGAKKWRWILLIEFGILVLLNLFTS